MRLSRASDFALRILMLLAKETEPLSVEEIASRLALAKSHVMKLVARLGASGLVETQRGRGGGVILGAETGAISIGQVVRMFESDFAVVDCLNPNAESCTFLPRCALKPVMIEATEAFLQSLDSHTLADVVAGTQRPRAAA